MNKISKKELLKAPEKLAFETGILQFYNGNKLLYVIYTFNLRRKFEQLSKSTDRHIFQLLSLTDTIYYEKHDNLFDSFMNYKVILYSHHPEYNGLLEDYRDFVYLAVSFDRVPYFKISEQTLENHWYLGPFRNRFFPLDLLDTMNRLYKFPLCESSNYPCELLKTEDCNGLCLTDKKELFNLIVQNYMFFNIDNQSKLKSEINNANDNLLFKKAESLKQKLKIIEKYYDLIYFFHITKHLDLETQDKRIKIKNGLLSEISMNDLPIDFPLIDGVYRNNEYLAFSKNELNERWIIYNHFRRKHSDLFERIYLKSKDKLLELLTD